MSANDIKLNYEHARNEIKELKSIADGLENASEHLAKTMKSLSGCWESNSASEYTNKGMHMAKKMQVTSEHMNALAGSMSSIVAALKEADFDNKKRLQNI